MRLPAPVVLGGAGLAPLALCVAVKRSRARDVAVCVLNMWAYIAAYEMPHDDPRTLAESARTRYPIVADRILGLGELPTVRLQQTFSKRGEINRFERVLVGCHWIWFFTPHASVVYILFRRPNLFPRAAAQMYAVFDLGVTFYWTTPTAPPWWAAREGRMGRDVEVRRMMIEYGPLFWRDAWTPLYAFLGGNPLAAMPSLHFATSVMGAHLLSEAGPVAGAIGWTYAGALGLALVYLGEHYLIDLIGGAALTEVIRAGAPRAAPLARRLGRGLDALRALGAE
jgi:hypothetical protein